MSDFLRNLRSSHKKDTSDPRRNLDGHYYPQTERRRIPDRRANSSESLETLWSSLSDLLPQLVETTTQLNQILKKAGKENTLLTEAKIRHYNAVSLFFENLNVLCQQDHTAPSSEHPPKATTSYTTGTHYTKDDILSTIRKMRKDGTTFAVIAAYLKDKGIPTFSGRGEWHAQTIHRLCK